MARYRFAFRKISTGRINKGQASARSEAELRELLAEKNDIAEILSIERVPEAPATERQVEYLRDLGVSVAPDLLLSEASDLIENAHRRRSPGTEQDRKLAEFYDVEVTRYASKASIFEAILADLRQRDDLFHLAQWYVYRVYRNGFDRGGGGGISDPGNAVITAIAHDMIKEASLLRSLKRDAGSSVAAFRWFGELAQGRDIRVGDSNRTAAYVYAAGRLKAEGLLTSVRRKAFSSQGRAHWETERSPSPDNVSSRPSSPANGCLLWIILGGLAVLLYLWMG